MSIFAIGDIHGMYKLLIELMNKIPLSNGDTLVFIGDYIDRGDESQQVVSYLLDLRKDRKNTILLRGNHEEIAYDCLTGAEEGDAWILNGGNKTIESYGKNIVELNENINILGNLPLWHSEGKFFFSHAGLNPRKRLSDQTHDDLIWDRDCFYSTKESIVEKEQGITLVFGHTPSLSVVQKHSRICIDTGACFGNKLTCIQLPENKIYQTGG
jgi:serine/threonine protein phosphatase 1